MIKLVRDKIPELIRNQGTICNFAKIQNVELKSNFLRNKLMEEVNEFLQAKPSSQNELEELVDIYTVLKALYITSGFSDSEFMDMYSKKAEMNGDLTEGYIVFFPDTAASMEVNSDA